MSDLTPCPTCQSMLRIPAGAGMIRCPKCKTVLAVEGTAEPTAPPAPPAGKPAAPPLPFGRPPAKPVAAKPAAEKPTPSKPAAARPAAVRARLAPVSANDLDEEASDESPEGIRRRELREKLREMEEREEREEERFEEARTHCRYSRLGLKLLAYGCLAATFSGVFYVLFLILSLVTDPNPTITIAFLGAGFMLLVHYILASAGLGFCVAGLPAIRLLAGAGLVCTALQFIVAILAYISIAKSGYLLGIDKRGTDPEAYTAAIMLLSAVGDNLVSAPMIPFLLIARSVLSFSSISWSALAVPWVGAILEFARISMLGVVGNRHAVEAKSPELGHVAMRFVYRIFGVVIVATILFPLTVPAALLMADIFKMGKLGTGPGGSAMIPVGMVLNAYFLWWTYTWYAQYQTLTDVADVTDPVRVAHEGELAEEY